MNRKKIIGTIIIILLIGFIINEMTSEGIEGTFIKVIYKRRQGNENVLIVNEVDRKGRLVKSNEIFVIENAMAYDIIEMGDEYMVHYEIHKDKRYIVELDIFGFPEE